MKTPRFDPRSGRGVVRPGGVSPLPDDAREGGPSTVTIEEFTQRYPPQKPARAADAPEELRLLSEAEGVRSLDAPPAIGEQRISPRCLGDPREGRHLWVFFENRASYVLELAQLASPPLPSGRAKHTNLTGGAPASCGGELWLDPVDHNLLYLNGGSGRYGPKTPEQLEDAVGVFEARGYEVVSFGWDVDTDRPLRILR